MFKIKAKGIGDVPIPYFTFLKSILVICHSHKILCTHEFYFNRFFTLIIINHCLHLISSANILFISFLLFICKNSFSGYFSCKSKIVFRPFLGKIHIHL